MKQGTEYVYVKVSLALFKANAGEWSRPVLVKLQEEYDGEVALVTKDVSGLSLREIAQVFQ